MGHTEQLMSLKLLLFLMINVKQIEMVDPYANFPAELFPKLWEIALSCCENTIQQRPTIYKVIKQLEEIDQNNDVLEKRSKTTTQEYFRNLFSLIEKHIENVNMARLLSLEILYSFYNLGTFSFLFYFFFLFCIILIIF